MLVEFAYRFAWRTIYTTNKILNIVQANFNKHKFTFTNAFSKKKKAKIKTSSQPVSKKSSDSNDLQQLSIMELLPQKMVTRRKRKMSISDAEHPFKHKRFKSKDKDETDE